MSVLNAAAGPMIDAIRYLRTHRLGFSAVALAVMLVAGIAYLTFGTLRMDPTRSFTGA